MVKFLMVAIVVIAAGCSADPKGEEWTVGEMATNNTTTNGNPNNMTPATNGSPATTGGPGVVRVGAAEGGQCSTTIDCAGGLECADVAEFESPPELRCAAPECFCADLDTTYCFEGDCALANRNCVLDGCPTGYGCVEKVCVCDGPECEGGCRGDDHCNWDEICIDGACKDAHCAADDQCPARYVCGAGQNDRFCRIAGVGGVGDDCTFDEDCADGYCYDGVTCVAPCMQNSECGDRECSVPDHFDLAVPYCQAPSCGDCADDQYCRNGTCDADPCPAGECSWNAF